MDGDTGGHTAEVPAFRQFSQLQQITRYPYLAGPATAPVLAIMPYGRGTRGIGGEYVAAFSTRNLNRSPTHQPGGPIDSGCFCIRMHVSLPALG
jgi:hypothetical protein